MNALLMDTEESAASRLQSLVGAAYAALEGLDHVDACRFGSHGVLIAAVEDMRVRLDELDRMSPRATGVTIAALVAAAEERGDGPMAASLASTLQSTVQRIHERSAGLSLEFRRLLADTQDVVRVGTGSPGTYDSMGRAASNPFRRDRAHG